jgi:NhaP-type Na+/H+ or K+/H+ antiporter
VWRLVLLAICVLLFRRLPVILALYKFIPDVKTFREAAFTGWFGGPVQRDPSSTLMSTTGPMGVGAIFIGTLALTQLPEGEADHDTEQVDQLRQVLLPIVSFLVLSSVISREHDHHFSPPSDSYQMACPFRSSPLVAASTA